MQHEQEILDDLSELETSIMTRYEQYEQGQEYSSSLMSQAPVFNPTQKPLVAHRGINSHNMDTVPVSASFPASASPSAITSRCAILH